MSLTAAKCTNCGGILEVDSSNDAAICPYCNTPYIVEKAINNYYSDVKSLDELLKDAKTFIELGSYEDASKKYKQVIISTPSDSRGWMGFIRLAIEHHTSLEIEGTGLNPLRGALKYGDADFLKWFYNNFSKDERLISIGLKYVLETENDSVNNDFLDCLYEIFEDKCKKIRRGESSIEKEFGQGAWNGTWNNGYLQLNCDHIACVKELLNESKINDSYYKNRINQLGEEAYSRVAEGVIYRLWQPKWCSFDYSGTISRDLQHCDGGLVGNIYYQGYDYDHGYVPKFYYLKVVVTKEEIDRLFQEMFRCYSGDFCPYCGIGKKRFFTSKCNKCGHWL